jgi:uncharacterized protein
MTHLGLLLAAAVVSLLLPDAARAQLQTQTQTQAEGPNFDCRKAAKRTVLQLICRDEALARLDRQLAAVYSAVLKKTVNERPVTLRAEQRGWVKGRDDCWKSPDVRACVDMAYRQRIAELQARYRLVDSRGPFTWVCGGPASGEVIMRFFATDPPVAIAERGDAVSLMFQQPAASGARYAGRNESFWEHQGEARVQWGYGVPEMRCTLRP